MRRPYAIDRCVREHCQRLCDRPAPTRRESLQHPLSDEAEADAGNARGPTLRELASFAGPAVVLWGRAGYLLTLIDTSAVGLASGAKDSALDDRGAMAPAGPCVMAPRTFNALRFQILPRRTFGVGDGRAPGTGTG